jgi:hypothetical protein
MRRSFPSVLALPSGVKMADIDWLPSKAELEYEKFLREKAEFEKCWLQEATAKLALVACILEQERRDEELEKWHLRHHAFQREQAAKQQERDAAEISKYMAAMQEAFDAPEKNKLLARVQAAGRDIRRQDASIERDELLRRGVVRGTR